MKTNLGDIKIKLDFEGTPITAKNFLSYVDSGFYDGTIFHRVINNFMVQGGGFTEAMEQKESNDSIENEAKFGQQNKRGTLAMARTGEPHSATSQFFINVKDNDFLNFRSATPDGFGYCVFGEVVEGMDVIDSIKIVQTTNRMGHQDVPTDAVIIQSMTVIEDESNVAEVSDSADTEAALAE